MKTPKRKPNQGKKGHVVSAFSGNNDIQTTHCKASTETYTVKKQNVAIVKNQPSIMRRNNNNNNEGMAFDRFEYGLD